MGVIEDRDKLGACATRTKRLKKTGRPRVGATGFKVTGDGGEGGGGGGREPATLKNGTNNEANLLVDGLVSNRAVKGIDRALYISSRGEALLVLLPRCLNCHIRRNGGAFLKVSDRTRDRKSRPATLTGRPALVRETRSLTED
jgi:hypothetical protein